MPVPAATIGWLAGLIRGHRTRIGKRRRKGTPAQQAALVPAMLRKDERLLDLAMPNGISASTLRRWLLEVIGLLSGRAPRPNRMLRRLSARAQVVVLADGTP